MHLYRERKHRNKIEQVQFYYFIVYLYLSKVKGIYVVMNNRDNKLNVIFAFLLQIISIITGFILSKLILSCFGSQVNGLVSSINQFLGLISLLEGGLTAVIMSQLYKPIEENNIDSISSIISAAKKYFRQIGIIFFIYSILLSIVYPRVVKQDFVFFYVSSLILIMSLSTIIQYFFSLTYKIFLQANQKNYIVCIVIGVTQILNLCFAILCILYFPSIHLLKIFGSILFIFQPVIFHYFVKKYFSINKTIKSSTKILKNRWNGFFQNLTYFITMNTDVIVLTFFLSLSEVSVYSIYMLVINAIRQLITSTAGGFQSALGKDIARKDRDKLRSDFDKFSLITSNVSIVFFCVTLLLIVPFIKIYTKEVFDVNYIRPSFATVIVIANLYFCIREPYRLVIISAGKFKETNFGAVTEACLNVFISVVLVSKFGLIGVAIGTLIATVYRYIYFLIYVKKNLLDYGIRSCAIQNIIYLIEVIAAIYLSKYLDFSFISNFGYFITTGFIVTLIFSVIQWCIYNILQKY